MKLLDFIGKKLDDSSDFIDMKLENIRRFLWAIRPKNWKFWMVKPETLTVQYNDSSDLYLHSTMKIVCDFYDANIEHDNVSWDTQELSDVWNEIESIVYWWRHVYPTYDLVWKKPDHIVEPNSWSSRVAGYEEYWEWLNEAAKQEVMNDKTEQEMVERLAKVYKYLWI